MAISNGGNFEVDSLLGDDLNNSGYFNAAGSGAGTDFTLVSPLACSDLAVDATTNTLVSSASIGFTAAHVRNGLRITAGTGFAAGLYEITAVGGGKATLDRSPGAVGIAGGTARVGGALASPGMASSFLGVASGVYCYLKYRPAAYTLSSAANVSGGRIAPAGGGFVLIGYDSVRSCWGGGNRPVLDCGAASMTAVTMPSFGTSGVWNCVLDNSGAFANVNFVSLGAGFSQVRNCTFRRGTPNSTGVLLSGASGLVDQCLFDSNAGSYTLQVQGGGSVVSRCEFVADGAGTSAILVPVTGGVVVVQDVLLRASAKTSSVVGCGAGNGRVHLSRVTAVCTAAGGNVPVFEFANVTAEFSHCLAVGAQGTGRGFAGAVAGAWQRLLNCAGYNNAGGNYSVPAGSVEGFVALTADPFTNSAAGDLSLNNAAGGGAAARGRAWTYPAGTTTSYGDVGAAQHADPAGGGASRPRIFTGY